MTTQPAAFIAATVGAGLVAMVEAGVVASMAPRVNRQTTRQAAERPCSIRVSNFMVAFHRGSGSSDDVGAKLVPICAKPWKPHPLAIPASAALAIPLSADNNVVSGHKADGTSRLVLKQSFQRWLQGKHVIITKNHNDAIVFLQRFADRGKKVAIPQCVGSAGDFIEASQIQRRVQ